MGQGKVSCDSFGPHRAVIFWWTQLMTFQSSEPWNLWAGCERPPAAKRGQKHPSTMVFSVAEKIISFSQPFLNL